MCIFVATKQQPYFGPANRHRANYQISLCKEKFLQKVLKNTSFRKK